MEDLKNAFISGIGIPLSKLVRDINVSERKILETNMAQLSKKQLTLLGLFVNHITDDNDVLIITHEKRKSEKGKAKWVNCIVKSLIEHCPDETLGHIFQDRLNENYLQIERSTEIFRLSQFQENILAEEIVKEGSVGHFCLYISSIIRDKSKVLSVSNDKNSSEFKKALCAVDALYNDQPEITWEQCLEHIYKGGAKALSRRLTSYSDQLMAMDIDLADAANAPPAALVNVSAPQEHDLTYNN